MALRPLLCLVFVGVLVPALVSGLYTSKHDVISATDKNFNSIVLQSPKFSIVEFFAPWCGHCKQLAPEYIKLATQLKGLVNVVAVDADAAEGRSLAGRYEVKGFPTLKFFSPENSIPEDYSGPRTASGMAQWILSKLHTKNIQKVTDKSAASFFKEKGIKALLFSSKKESSSLYKALSFEFKGRLVLGEVHQDQKELVKKYGIDSFPTVIIIKDDEPHTTIKFDGELKYAGLSAFFETHALPKKAPQQSPAGKKPAAKEPVVEEEEEKPAPLVELKTQADFDQYCAQKGGLCVLAFVPGEEEDAEARTAAVNTLEALVKANTKRTFKFMWLDGRKEKKFREAFGLSDDLPVMCVLNPAKKRYAPYLGSFTQEGVTEFLERMLAGSKRTVSLDALPSLSE